MGNTSKDNNKRILTKIREECNEYDTKVTKGIGVMVVCLLFFPTILISALVLLPSYLRPLEILLFLPLGGGVYIKLISKYQTNFFDVLSYKMLRLVDYKLSKFQDIHFFKLFILNDIPSMIDKYIKKYSSKREFWPMFIEYSPSEEPRNTLRKMKEILNRLYRNILNTQSFEILNDKKLISHFENLILEFYSSKRLTPKAIDLVEEIDKMIPNQEKEKLLVKIIKWFLLNKIEIFLLLLVIFISYLIKNFSWVLYTLATLFVKHLIEKIITKTKRS